MKLTKAQREMLQGVLATGAAWVTATECVNHDLLRGWTDRGWAREVPPPAGLTGLVAYQITPAGRAALESQP